MEMKIMYGAALFLAGWLWFYLFPRQFLFNIMTAFPLIKKMRALRDELIAVGAVRYTVVSVVVSLFFSALLLGIVLWLCPPYMIIGFAIGAVLALVMFIGKLGPTNRPMFEIFCTGYCRFVPDDELRTAMYNKQIDRMESRLLAMGINGTFIPEFKK